jgi:NUMOD4 motif
MSTAIYNLKYGENTIALKSTDTLEKEIEWKTIPNFFDAYEVSNTGIVQSLDRTITTKDGRTIFYKGKIMKKVVVKYPNRTTNDYVLEEVCNLSYAGQKKRIQIARLVYSLFVQSIDFSKDGLMILHNNNNHLDNRVANLVAVSHSVKTLLMWQNNRVLPLYKLKNNKKN